MSELSSPARYRQLQAQKEIPLVEVVAPSGFTFIFRQPNVLGIILGGDIPQTAASEAAAAWANDGVGKTTVSEESAEAIGKRFIQMRDKMAELSHTPKIVFGKAVNDSELSIDEISDEDLGYLLRWTAAGGNASAMLAMFPQGSPKSSPVRPNRKKQRHPRK